MDERRRRLAVIDEQLAADPNFWEQPTKSASILQEKRSIELVLGKVRELEDLGEELQTALDLAREDSSFLGEAERLFPQLQLGVQALEIQSLLTDPLDASAVLLTINSGAGGTESCDWAAMLLRMYLRFCEQKEWKAEIHDIQPGEEAGIKSVTVEITGTYAFGLLKAEIGVHRLVRISPFDSNARRHTSFASVFASPVIEDKIEIEVNPSDLRIDTYRASGAGGQHVNRTDSAVRITHRPSGIVVQCQSQRSQHQNRDTAMKMLKSRLYELELAERRKQQKDVEAEKADINFGSQIRSYVLHPYKLVKDHRSNFEVHDPDKVLDGQLLPFIEEYLAYSKK